MKGLARIIAERKRQIEQEGWTPEHDAQHTGGKREMSAAYFCWPDAPKEVCHGLLFPYGQRFRTTVKREGDTKVAVGELVKAGALIAAEIDRRLAAGEEA